MPIQTLLHGVIHVRMGEGLVVRIRYPMTRLTKIIEVIVITVCKGQEASSDAEKQHEQHKRTASLKIETCNSAPAFQKNTENPGQSCTHCDHNLMRKHEKIAALVTWFVKNVNIFQNLLKNHINNQNKKKL